MIRMTFVGVLLALLIGQAAGQLPEGSSPNEVWQKANLALHENRLGEAMRLYKKLLDYSNASSNRLGEVDALEAIALTYKKRKSYNLSTAYCLKSIETGMPTFRAYYILAQIAFEQDNDIARAQRYCTEGLQAFPNNSDLMLYRNLLNRRLNESPTTAQRKYHNAALKSDTTIGSVDFLSPMEVDIVKEMNFARTRPRQYVKLLEALAEHYEGDLLRIPGKIPVRTNEGIKAVQEAIKYLKNVKAVGPLKISRGMSRAAADHVHDQEKSGQTGHIGEDGSQPYQRMERYGTWEGLSGENIAYGDDSARMFIMQLIIDDGVPGRGHRENMFNDEFRVTGVSIGSHPVYRSMCVITYASGYTEK